MVVAASDAELCDKPYLQTLTLIMMGHFLGDNVLSYFTTVSSNQLPYIYLIFLRLLGLLIKLTELKMFTMIIYVSFNMLKPTGPATTLGSGGERNRKCQRIYIGNLS